jgi:replicative DNA helicase
VQRRLIAAGTRLVHLGRSTDDGDLQDVIAAAEAEVEAVASGVTAESGAVRVGDILDDYLDRLEEPEENPGIEWPYADVNRLLRPMRPGRLYVVGALSGVGKSIACWNVAAHAALRHKQRVLFHALEMSTDELMDRLIAAEARVSVGSVSAHTLGKGDWDRIAKAREHLDDAPLFVDESEYVTLSSLRASIRRVKPDLVIVDQLPIMTPPDTRAPREQQMAALAYGLKRLAKAENVPIIAAAQLNRESGEARRRQAPHPARPAGVRRDRAGRGRRDPAPRPVPHREGIPAGRGDRLGGGQAARRPERGHGVMRYALWHLPHLRQPRPREDRKDRRLALGARWSSDWQPHYAHTAHADMASRPTR